MRTRFGNRRGQTMVEYIIIVVLIAIALIVLFSKLSKAVGTKVAGATSSLWIVRLKSSISRRWRSDR